MVLVACRLSQSLKQPCGGPAPYLAFWLSSLQKALDEDPFWGPGFWKDIENRASSLENGILQLAQQCHELGSLIPGHDIYRRTSTSFAATRNASTRKASIMSIKPQSRLTMGQSLTNQEWIWMQRIILSCWTTLLTDATEAKRKNSVSPFHINSTRARSHTS